MFEFRVFGPDYARKFLQPHPSGMWGVQQLRYLGTGLPCVNGQGGHLNPGDLVAVIDQMQWLLALGVIGDLEFLVTDLQLLATDDPA